MNPLWLLVIIPLSASFGMLVMSWFIVAANADRKGK